jgi:hypothetical protein
MIAMNPLPTVESQDGDCREGCTDIDIGATLEPAEPDCDPGELPHGDGEFVRCSCCYYLYRVDN